MLTDQSFKKMCDINLIMKKYVEKGELPNFKTKTPRYVDNTQIPTLLEAHEIVQKAKEMFYELPSQVRKAMDNNPANLEIFISDPENEKLLTKHGLLVEKTTPKESPEVEQLKAITKEIQELVKKTDK